MQFHFFFAWTFLNFLARCAKGACTNHVDSHGGRGVSEMSTLLYNPYRVKLSTKGGGWGEKVPKTVHVV